MLFSLTFLISIIQTLINSWQLLFTIYAISFSFKFSLFGFLIYKKIYSTKTPYQIYLLMLILFSSLICDIAWLLTPFINYLDFRIYNTLLRLAWIFTIILFQALALFIEHLTSKQYIFIFRQKIFCFISSFLVSTYLTITVIDFHCANFNEKHWIEIKLSSVVIIYQLFLLLLPSIFKTIQKLQMNNIPRLLTKQVKLLIVGIIIPFWLSEFLQAAPLLFSPQYWINTSYAIANINNILITYAIFYSIRKIIKLRFLNLNHAIESPININFMPHFKTILERLGHVANTQELSLLVQEFFKESFKISFNKVTLHIRTDSNPTENMLLIESFLASHSNAVCKEFYKHKIMIYDDMVFNNFYEQNESRDMIVQFLSNIQADIFLPIYEKENLTAYIIVEKEARTTHFYSQSEQDEMLIFTSYLSNIINLIKNQSINTLIEQEKILQEELYRKHQEINQYKESIRSFIRSSDQQQIGIVFYKNRIFSCGNQAAQEMIKINPNVQAGHPIAQAFKQVATNIEQYKTAQTCLATDPDSGTTFILSGIPNLENNNSIITVSYPAIADTIKQHIDKLYNPSERDYLLYLETTKSGTLINKLIPGTGEVLLNFKIELLKTALGRQATLLSIPEEDLDATVELLHHISLRDTLHTIHIQAICKTADIAISLFGINPIFNLNTSEAPLLEKLHMTGTLFIKNIHYLDLETQKYLAEYIRYGFYKMFKSEHKKISSVRIICSTDQNLHDLVNEGLFSKDLFNQLKKTTLIMPSLATLSEDEWKILTHALIEQTIESSSFKSLFTLSPKDKQKLVLNRPSSLSQLKKRVLLLINNKSQKREMDTEMIGETNASTAFNPIKEIEECDNPELIEISRLGKLALKNQYAMNILWQTFKNQNQIAAFLGVNRSSVNRRCKLYNLNS